MTQLVAPPEDAALALAKKTHWRVCKKPPTIHELSREPARVVLTALASPTERLLVVKVDNNQWLITMGTEYATCVEQWRAAASSSSASALVDDTALAARIPNVIYAWCINRMYTDAGTLPPRNRGTSKSKSKPKPKPKSKSKSRSKGTAKSKRR
jgi:hypothetical protein